MLLALLPPSLPLPSLPPSISPSFPSPSIPPLPYLPFSLSVPPPSLPLDLQTVLEGESLGHCHSLFAAQEVDYHSFVTLTGKDLEELGFTSSQDRGRLMSLIDRLNSHTPGEKVGGGGGGGALVVVFLFCLFSFSSFGKGNNGSRVSRPHRNRWSEIHYVLTCAIK